MTDKELLRVVAGFRKGILGRRKSTKMCFAVCFPLQTFLSGCGVENKLTEGRIKLIDHNEGISINHFWITLNDGRIVDPTADQFNFNMKGREDMPPVYLGKKPDWYILKRKKKK